MIYVNLVCVRFPRYHEYTTIVTSHTLSPVQDSRDYRIVWHILRHYVSYANHSILTYAAAVVQNDASRAYKCPFANLKRLAYGSISVIVSVVVCGNQNIVSNVSKFSDPHTAREIYLAVITNTNAIIYNKTHP